MTDQPDTVQHEGEYILTVGTDVSPGMLRLHRVGEQSFIPELTTWKASIFDELADPDKPVRVRLELRAVRVEEESDGE